MSGLIQHPDLSRCWGRYKMLTTWKRQHPVLGWSLINESPNERIGCGAWIGDDGVTWESCVWLCASCLCTYLTRQRQGMYMNVTQTEKYKPEPQRRMNVSMCFLTRVRRMSWWIIQLLSDESIGQQSDYLNRDCVLRGLVSNNWNRICCIRRE